MEWPQRLRLTDRDLQYMKAYTSIMGLLKEKSDALGAENSSTIHLVVPALIEISSLKINIGNYFDHVTDQYDPKFDPIFLTATYLSPIHRHILNKRQIQLAESHLKELIKSYEDKEVVQEEDNSDVDIEQETDDTTFKIPGLKFLSSKIMESDNGGGEDVVESDFAIYFSKSKQVLAKLKNSGSKSENNEATTNAPIDPIDFWTKALRSKQYGSELASVAVDVMEIPASSVPSEHLLALVACYPQECFITLNQSTWNCEYC